jgi:predicted RNase H-like HicB family nuclease
LLPQVNTREAQVSQTSFTYTAVYERDPETREICASVPALDLGTHGPTLEEARAHLREALELHLEGLIEEQMPIPPDVLEVERLTVQVSSDSANEVEA